ncbi:MAG: hypothetical protein M1818_006405 [Claussenomyces sp. TS43310]|nr:MAG: hypothetical protein M1818_006405 [Claussenomyces sp. TS43310]
MRVAIAGSGGLAQHIAHFLNETPHLFIILSRAAKPNLEALGYQVVVVNYDDQRDLRYALQGHDLVISTISGVSQINLIDAASHARVRRFVPSEFEGLPARRPADSPFDDGRAAALSRLRDIAASNRRRPMKFTCFICGVFYERFARGGLARKAIALGSGWEHQGAFMLDIDNNRGEVIEHNSAGQDLRLCMTSLSDVACFVVEALDIALDRWPEEFKMRGDRRTVTQIIQYAEAIKGVEFGLIVWTPSELAAYIRSALDYQNYPQATKLQLLIPVVNRQYDFSTANLNDAVAHRPEKFKDWLRRQWAT